MDGSSDGIPGVGGGVFSGPSQPVVSGQPVTTSTPAMSQGGGDIVLPGDGGKKQWWKSKLLWLIMGAVLVVAAVVGVLVWNGLRGEQTGGERVGDAINAGPGELRMVTLREGTERYYRAGVDSGLYRADEFEVGADDGLSYIPLSCVRTVFYGLEADAAACEEESANGEEFGSEFFGELRGVYGLFDGVENLPSKLVLQRVWRSAGRVFVTATLTDGGETSYPVLEYKDGGVREVLRFAAESVIWVEALGGEA